MKLDILLIAIINIQNKLLIATWAIIINSVMELNTSSFNNEHEFFYPPNKLWEVLLLEILFLSNPTPSRFANGIFQKRDVFTSCQLEKV